MLFLFVICQKIAHLKFPSLRLLFLLDKDPKSFISACNRKIKNQVDILVTSPDHENKVFPTLNKGLKQHYLVDQANMITIMPLKKVLDSFPSVRTALSSASLFFLLPFLITLEPLSSGLHLKSSLPFSSLTISASATPFILLWGQANLVLCVCSLPQKPPGLPVSPASSTSWWNPYWPFCW